MQVRRALALAAVLPLLVAGCSEDEPKPKMPDPTPSSSSSTPTAEPTQEQESPEDFVRRWQAAADKMVVTGDTTEFERISRGCDACAEYAERIKAAYADGGSVAFGGSAVESIKRTEQNPPTFVVAVSSKPLTIEVPGQQEQTFPAATQNYRVTLARRGDSWQMRHYAVI